MANAGRCICRLWRWLFIGAGNDMSKNQLKRANPKRGMPGSLRNLLFFGFCLCVVLVLAEANKKYAGRERPHLRDIDLPDYVFKVPGERYNFRSAQLTLDQLDSLLRKGLIRRVIRLNGNGKDSGGVPAEQEKALCEKRKVDFKLLNAQEKGIAPIIHQLLLEGRCLIHCLHGYDRTGAMVGYHLRRFGYSGEEVIRFNGWEGYFGKKGKSYVRYLNLIQ